MTAQIDWDCPICETWSYQWNADGCSCWWCSACKTTNPEWDNECRFCGRNICTDCGQTIVYNDTTESWEGEHSEGCFMDRS